jgi:hypothetical protein
MAKNGYLFCKEGAVIVRKSVEDQKTFEGLAKREVIQRG